MRHLINDNIPKDADGGLDLVEVIEPKRHLNELVLNSNLRMQIERVIIENHHAEELLSFGLRPQKKILFCGPPGCGKTVAAEAVAQSLFLPLAVVQFDAVISSYLGGTASNLRKIFDFAKSNPVVLFLDEFDAVGKERSSHDEHGELKRVVISLLQLLDAQNGGSITIAASNHQSLLDSAVWRRFDEVISFKLPSKEERHILLEMIMNRIRIDEKIHLATFADALDGFSFADIERVGNDAMKNAVLDGRLLVTNSDFDLSVSRLMLRRESERN